MRNRTTTYRRRALLTACAVLVLGVLSPAAGVTSSLGGTLGGEDCWRAGSGRCSDPPLLAQVRKTWDHGADDCVDGDGSCSGGGIPRP